MPRKCPFVKGLMCGRPASYCAKCPERIKSGQKTLIPINPTTKKTVTNIDISAVKVTCPYCLYTDYITRFYMRLKSGRISEKRFKCPDCGEVMRRDTLTKRMTVEEYAQWAYELGKHFWSRVNFSKFKRRLREMGISKQFWEAYKKAKSEFKDQYEEYLDTLYEQLKEEMGYSDSSSTC